MGCNSSSAAIVHAEPEIKDEVKDFHDQYLLGVKLGRGAFAQVRICTDVDKDSANSKSIQEKAVKILDLRDKNDPSQINRSLHKAACSETSVWRTVGDHANSVRLYDVFYSTELCYMVMEKCKCGLLPHFESQTDLNERFYGGIFVQMFAGIMHVHSLKVVHRDIKPDNYLIGEDGQTVKLCDYGLSAIITKAGKLCGVYGTAPFMCPEMLGGRPYDDKADVWSLAVLVYALLFGNFPYMPKEQSSKGMKAAIIEGTPAPKFEPVSKSTKENANFRTDNAVSFAKTLLNRDPEQRTSAPEALKLAYMAASLENSHAKGSDLPSLRPSLHMAKKVGAFEVRDPSRETGIDSILNKLQLAKHDKPLPEVRPPVPIIKDTHTKKPKVQKTDTGSGWDIQSNPSTACSGSDITCSQTSSNFGFKGSGWSKGSSIPLSNSRSHFQ
jgi:serine/threonine protein kinase|mmetsp:Transcript_105626/g.166715  ORF Transcript_105626/g.166715 Transcript_105626/m.166715 type:complete len:440 (-) Transcript_105626:60-1379(-)